MTDKIQLSGLCINCLHSDDCNYRLNHTKPIIFCEEFSCAGPSESKNHSTKIIKKMGDSKDPRMRGLCSNCENSKTCTLQKKGALVINCEEYK